MGLLRRGGSKEIGSRSAMEKKRNAVKKESEKKKGKEVRKGSGDRKKDNNEVGARRGKK